MNTIDDNYSSFALLSNVARLCMIYAYTRPRYQVYKTIGPLV